MRVTKKKGEEVEGEERVTLTAEKKKEVSAPETR